MLVEINFKCENCGRELTGTVSLSEEVDEPQPSFYTCKCGEDHTFIPGEPEYSDGEICFPLTIEGDDQGKTTDQLRTELIEEYKEMLGDKFYLMSPTDIRVGFVDLVESARVDDRISNDQCDEMEGWEG